MAVCHMLSLLVGFGRSSLSGYCTLYYYYYYYYYYYLYAALGIMGEALINLSSVQSSMSTASLRNRTKEQL